MAVSGLSNGAPFRRWTAVLVALIAGIASLQLPIAQSKQLGQGKAGSVGAATAASEAAAEAPHLKIVSLPASDQSASVLGASGTLAQKSDPAVANHADIALPSGGTTGSPPKASGLSQSGGVAPGSTGDAAYAIDVTSQPAGRQEAATAAPPVQSPHTEKRKALRR
jgi:hypothetical protein